MKALVFTEIKKELEFKEVSEPSISEGKVLVEVKAAALNRRDYWITLGMYPGVFTPTILGSDGCGIYEGEEVIFSPNIGWGENQNFPNKDYVILGLEEFGTFAEKISIRESSIFPKPEHLTIEQAAALPLAGLTAYRVLFSRCQLKPNEKVLITGVGGGVALFVTQFALAFGAEVYVTSGSDEKLAKAKALGVSGGGNYKEEDWHKKMKKEHGTFDVIIDSAGGEGFKDLIYLAAPGARIGLYGGTRGAWQNINPAHVFFKQLSILGSTMGSDLDFERMLSFVSEYEIVPIIDRVFDLKDGNKAFELMKTSPQFGKYVLKI